MANLKSVAALFGMTVSELEQFTGYSRQEFHRVLDNGKAVGTVRMMDTIRKLDAASYDIYSAAVSQAEAEKKAREKLLKSLANICGLCYQTGPCLYIRQYGHPGWEGSKCRGFSAAIGEEPAEQCMECEQWCYYGEDSQEPIEPRYQLDRDSICYGCQNYKAVEDCEEAPEPDNVLYGGACDCAEPCFAGSQNRYHKN